jgi:hypothetical protein
VFVTLHYKINFFGCQRFCSNCRNYVASTRRMTVLERLWKEVAPSRLKLPTRDLPGGKHKVGEGHTHGGQTMWRDPDPQAGIEKIKRGSLM